MATEVAVHGLLPTRCVGHRRTISAAEDLRMPILAEELRQPRKRSHWPAWVAAGVVALLLIGVALLPLTDYSGDYGRVQVVFVRGAPSAFPQGYSEHNWGGKLYSVRVGSWHWLLLVN